MEYKIKKGDILSEIAQKMGVSVEKIASENPIKDINKIYAGEILEIPSQEVDDKTLAAKLNIPTVIRQFLSPYEDKTERDIPEDEMAALRDAWDNSQTPERLAEKKASRDAQAAGDIDPETGNVTIGVASNTIEYKDYGTRSEYGDVQESGFINVIKDLLDPRFGIKGTLGQASGYVDPETGKVTIRDQYNFNDRTSLQGLARLKSYLSAIPESGFGYGQLRNIGKHFGPGPGEGGLMNIRLANGGLTNIENNMNLRQQIYSRPMFQNPQQRAGGGIMAGVAPINMTSEPVYMDEGGSISGFLKEQSSASEDGIFGVFDGQPVTLRDATDFFLVDPNDPVDVAIASLSAALLVFPPAAAAATLARYGWKGKKAFEKLAEAQKRFAPSSVDKGNAAIDFAKRRVLPELESIEGGLNLIPGARFGAYETNRALSEGVQAAFDPEVHAEISSLATDIPYLVNTYYDEYTNPEQPDGLMENVPSVRADEDVLDTFPRFAGDPGIMKALPEGSPEGSPSAPVEDGGIADVARSIAEARSDKFKSATFRRGDEDLAAVTVEDLEESEFDSLKDYLNNMRFDKKEGRYVRDDEAVGMSRGGIMRLQDGSGPDGVVVEEDVQRFLDSMEISLDDFNAMPEEDQQTYMDVYESKLKLREDVRSKSAEGTFGLSQGLARLGDVINYIPEKATELYRDVVYGDIGKTFLWTDPLEERPTGEGAFSIDVGDPSFSESLNIPIDTTIPNIEDIRALKPPEPIVTASVDEEVVPTQELVDTTEEKPGFIASAYGALKDYHGMGGTSENERNAQRVANNTRREYGTSWQEVYNEALAGLELKDAQILESQAIAESRSITDMQREIEYLETRHPGISETELLKKYTLFKRGSDITPSDLGREISRAITAINKNWLAGDHEALRTAENKERSEVGLNPLNKNDYIKNLAKSTVYDAYGIINPSDLATAPSSDEFAVTARTAKQ